MILDPVFYLFAVPALIIVGIAKGGLGGGLGMLGVPLMALAANPVQAAAVMLPILILMDAFALQRYWRRWDRSHLGVLLPGAVVGILVGTFTFRYLSADHIRVLIGLIALTFVGHHVLGVLRGRPAPSERRDAHVPSATFWGSLAGFTSFGVHAGGPPVNVYLLRQGLDKTTFQATSVAFFAIVNLVKLPPYAWLGQLELGNLATSAVLAPLAPLGIWLGAWLHHRIDERIFFMVVYASLFAVGVRLVWQGLT